MRFEPIEYGNRLLIHTNEGTVLVCSSGWDGEYVEAEVLDRASLNELRREQMGDREKYRQRRNYPPPPIPGHTVAEVSRILKDSYSAHLELQAAMNRQIYGTDPSV